MNDVTVADVDAIDVHKVTIIIHSVTGRKQLNSIHEFDISQIEYR